MGYGSEHEREEVTKFHSKHHVVFIYNFLFYRGRRGLMEKRCGGCTRIRIYASSRYFLPLYVDL